jgi:hypothetical protein
MKRHVMRTRDEAVVPLGEVVMCHGSEAVGVTVSSVEFVRNLLP